MKAQTRVPVKERIRERVQENFQTVEAMGAAMVIGGCVWSWLMLQVYLLIFYGGPWSGSYVDALVYHLPVVEVGFSLPALFLGGGVAQAAWAVLVCEAISRGAVHRAQVMTMIVISCAVTLWASWTVYRSGGYLYGMAAWQLESWKEMQQRFPEFEERIREGEEVLGRYVRSL